MSQINQHIVYLSTGSNIGDRKEYLQEAFRLINEQVGKVIRQSSIYEAEPWGVENQKVYFNQVMCVETSLEPKQLLEIISGIESQMGRIREEKWAERTIDIDILFYDDRCIELLELVIPHPHIQERNFVLVPMLEIAPELVHPKLGLTIRELYFACTDHLKVYLN